jgi:hypothetical protein
VAEPEILNLLLCFAAGETNLAAAGGRAKFLKWRYCDGRARAVRLLTIGENKGRSERSERSYKTSLPIIRNAASHEKQP